MSSFLLSSSLTLSPSSSAFVLPLRSFDTWVFLKTVYLRNEQNVTDLHRVFYVVFHTFLECNANDTYVLRMTHIIIIIINPLPHHNYVVEGGRSIID